MDAPKPLDAAALRAALPEGNWDLVLVAETGSTNADVRAAAMAGTATNGRVLVAEHQVAGRGRRDRTWTSAPGTGLTFSVLVRPDVVPAAQWGWLPLLAGLAVAEGAGGAAGVPLALKWPNDVLDAGGGKVAGILVERIDSPSGPMAAIGIGLNVSAGAADLPVDTASSLALAGGTMLDRAQLLGAVLAALRARYQAWHAAAGDAAACGLATAYRGASATLGTAVRVDLPGEEVVLGGAEGLGADGSLQIRTADGLRSIAAGDVTHLRAAP